MVTQQLFLRIGAGLAAVCLSLAIPHAVHAATVIYTIDSSQSVLNLSGNFSGDPTVPQSPGALTDHFVGTITADSSDGVLTFSGGSAITALINPAGPFYPMANGESGTAPGNFGGENLSTGQFGAFRDLAFDILDGSVTNGGLPAVTLEYSSGVLDYDGLQTGPGQSQVTGETGPDSALTAVTLTTANGVETLRLPFRLSNSYSNSSGTLVLTFTGTIVGFRQVTSPWFTIDGGGGTSTGGVFAVRGTIGQPDAGRLTNGPSTLNSGFWSILAVQTPGAPLLSIARTPTNTVAVSWPSPSTGFGLQQNTNGIATVNWSNVVTEPSDDGTTKTLIVNPPTGNRFYRLFKP